MRRTYDETWIYHPNASAGRHLELDESESAHLVRVVRLTPETECTVTDGRGQVLKAVLEEAHPKRAILRCLELEQVVPPPRLGLGQAILKNRGLEDVVDLCCQTPVRRIQPLWTDHVQVAKNREFDHQLHRLQAKAIAALQQSKQAWLCEIPQPMGLEAWLGSMPAEESVAICDADGSRDPQSSFSHLAIGPEGGFSRRETEFFRERGVVRLSLGDSRLRATAAGFWALGRLS